MKIVFAALLSLLLFSPSRAETPPEPFASSPSLIGTPKIQFDEPQHNFGSIAQGNDIKHRFTFKNVGTADLVIHNAKGSCGCTVASVSSGPYKPGEQGTIDVSVDSRGKFGHIYKDVRVDSNDPKSPVTLAIEGMVMENAAHPPMQAGEVLFKGSCAECHSIPARGKSGKELYEAACAICHDPAPGSSPHKTLSAARDGLATLDSKTLKKIISNGLPETSMPAFAEKHSGPLTKKQIKSLVQYLESLRPAK